MKSVWYLILFAIAVVLIVLGGQKLLNQHDVKAVVHTFFTAIREGNIGTALNLLEPSLRLEAETRIAAQGDQELVFEPGLEYKIHKCTVKDREAEVEVWIHKAGFDIKPIVHLERSASNQWQIAGITNLKADPLWDDMQQHQSEEQDRQLTDQLRRELATQPGVAIEE